MKKSKLSVGLVTSFIGALALSACSSDKPAVTEKKDTIITLVGYNEGSDRIVINTDLYNEYKKTSEGREKFYSAILETLIRYEYPIISAREGSKLKKYETLLLQAQGKVNAAKQTAQDTADANGTTFDEEWEKILKSHDCKTTNDLKQMYLYDLEKEAMGDWYFKENQQSLKNHYIGVNADWSKVDPENGLEAVYPYHIQHVLVSLSAAKDNYNRGVITSGEATKLWSVVRELIDNSYSFEDVAKMSDDTGSKEKGGDVGIMSTKTSFYNEFKLGIYAYEAILSGVNSESEENKGIYKAMGFLKDVFNTTTQQWETQPAHIATFEGEETDPISVRVKDEMSNYVRTAVTEYLHDQDSTSTGYNGNIATVPYDVFRKISDLSEDGDKIGTFSPEAGDVALPRNVIYNQFLNFHSPFVITDEDIGIDNTSGTIATTDKLTIQPHDFSDPSTGLYIKETNFVAATSLGLTGVTGNVLTDGRGDVIIGVRSESGIHFMAMRKSVFKATNEYADKEDTSLEDYYTTLVPGEEGFPTGDTYVNMKKTDDESYYRDRSNEIKEELKKTDVYDPAYNYRLYETLLSDASVLDKITFFDGAAADSQIKQEIEAYIKSLRDNKTENDVNSMNSAWKSYINLLQKQNHDRAFDDALIPTTCAFHFNSTNKQEFEEGGICYVTSK